MVVLASPARIAALHTTQTLVAGGVPVACAALTDRYQIDSICHTGTQAM
jgi:hypothetical protein